MNRLFPCMSFQLALGILISLGVPPVGGQSETARPVPPSAGSLTENSASQTSAAIGNSEDTIHLPQCAVHLIDDIDVPAREAGVMVSLHVVEGQAISKDQPLAQIDDQLSQLQLEEAQLKHQIATEKAEDSSDIESAIRKQDVLGKILKGSEKLLATRSISEIDVEKDRYQKEIADFEVIKAKRDQRLAAKEALSEMVKVKAAMDSIARHKLVSPIDGHVFRVFKQAGEWVTAGETVMRIARMNKLKATGMVSARDYTIPQIMNRDVLITVKLPKSQSIRLPGKITYVEFERDGNGQDYRVWAEVDNKLEEGHWVLNPDDYVEMQILLK